VTPQEATSRAISQSELNTWFDLRENPNNEQRTKIATLRNQGKELAQAILLSTPPGPDQIEAIRMVREAVLLAGQAVVLG